MSVPLERWAKDAVEREIKGDFNPVADSRVIADVALLAELHRATWKRRERELIRSGVPLNMPEGTYGGLLSYPPAQTVTTTSINGTVNLYDNLTYSGLTKNSVLAPQAYRIAIPAKLTTGTTPGNLGFNPLVNTAGTWTTGGTAVAGGSTLGASGNVALTASIANAYYYIIGDLTIRNAGTASVITGMFHAVSTQNTAGGLAGPAVVGAPFNLMFGGTDVTVDTQTSTQSFQLGGVHTVATITHAIQQIHWMDWN